MAAIEQELLDQIRQLNVEQKRRVLDFVRTLTRSQGIPGEDLIARAHEVNFDPADLEEMRQVIESGCERI